MNDHLNSSVFLLCVAVFLRIANCAVTLVMSNSSYLSRFCNSSKEEGFILYGSLLLFMHLLPVPGELSDSPHIVIVINGLFYLNLITSGLVTVQ